DASPLGATLYVTFGAAAVLVESGPVVELEPQLGRVATEQQRLEEDRGLRVPSRLLVGEAEVMSVPLGLARDRLEDVRVDLCQGMVAGDISERVGQLRVAACVMERMPGFVQEGLVVVEPALGTRD